MNRKTFESTILENWTKHFGCPTESADQTGTTLLPESKYEGEKIIALWHIGKHAFVQLDPGVFPRLDELVKSLPENTSLLGEHVQTAWGDEAISSRDTGLTYYLFPADLPDYLPPEPFTLRPLTEADAEYMSALNAANTPEDVDEAYVEVTHQVAFGCFHGEVLVAAASGYERTGFLDLGVLTHPGYRKKGLGKAVVGALFYWAKQNNNIPELDESRK